MVWNALSLLFYAIASTAFLAFLGYGLAKLLLPEDWREEETLLAPLLGSILLLLVGYYGVRTVLDLRAVFWLVLILALGLDSLALWRRRGERLSVNWRELGPVWLVALLAFLLAVLPLFHYGYPTVIGENWDPENYLPVTEYLRQVPMGRIEEMPPNPLRELNANPPRIGLTLGFSILQGTLQQLRGWDALRSFAPTLALLRGLTILALYVLFRRGLGMDRWPALVATLFAGLYALGLWIALFNFGMQVAALPLVPLALALFLLALRQPGWRNVLLAAASVAVLPITYYPALTVFVPTALGLGLYELIQAERRRDVLLTGLAAALFSVVLALGTAFDYGAGFSFRYSQQMTTLGLFRFVSVGEILGLVPFDRAATGTPDLGLQIACLALLLPLILVALWRSRQRWLWLAALLPGVLYLGWLRGWFYPLVQALQQGGLLDAATAERFKPYAYAYMKGAVFVAPLVLALAIEGGGLLWGWLMDRLGDSRRRLAQVVLIGLLLLPLGCALRADRQLLGRYWPGPSHFDRAVIRMEEAVALLPEGASVYLTGRPERSRVQLGLFAYFLREHPVYGRLSLAYGAQDYRVPGEAPAYALLDADDDPLPLGFLLGDRIWTGDGMVLYQRDPAILVFFDRRQDAYAGRTPGEIHAREPLAERLLQSYGPYHHYPPSPGWTYSLFLSSARLNPDGFAGAHSALLGLAAFEPTLATLHWGDGNEESLDLPAGFSLYRSPPHALSEELSIEVLSGEAWPCWVALLGEEGDLGLLAQPQEVLLLPEVAVEGAVLEVDLSIHNDNGRPLRLALEVWEDTFQGAHHYAWWGPLVLPERGGARLQVDLQEKAAQAWVEGQEAAFPPGTGDWPAAADGSYFAALWIYYGQHVIQVVPLGQFNLAQGQVQDLDALDPSLQLLWPHSPEVPSGARFGTGIELSAYQRDEGPFDPGDYVPMALEWQALEALPIDYFVTVQILGEGRLWGQWDGLVGQWLPTSSWRPGQYLRDDIPLHVDPEAPPGRYRLIVAVYDVNTGNRLPLYSPEGEPLGDILDLGGIIVR